MKRTVVELRVPITEFAYHTERPRLLSSDRMPARSVQARKRELKSKWRVDDGGGHGKWVSRSERWQRHDPARERRRIAGIIGGPSVICTGAFFPPSPGACELMTRVQW